MGQYGQEGLDCQGGNVSHWHTLVDAQCRLPIVSLATGRNGGIVAARRNVTTVISFTVQQIHGGLVRSKTLSQHTNQHDASGFRRKLPKDFPGSTRIFGSAAHFNGFDNDQVMMILMIVVVGSSELLQSFPGVRHIVGLRLYPAHQPLAWERQSCGRLDPPRPTFMSNRTRWRPPGDFVYVMDWLRSFLRWFGAHNMLR